MKLVEEMTLDEFLAYLRGRSTNELKTIASDRCISKNLRRDDLIERIHKNESRKRGYKMLGM